MPLSPSTVKVFDLASSSHFPQHIRCLRKTGKGGGSRYGSEASADNGQNKDTSVTGDSCLN